MKDVKINLQFRDKGYGITGFYQTIELEEPLQIEARGFAEHEGERVNTLAAPAWEWVCQNENTAIKDFLAKRLVETFKEMRQKGEKHVPDEDYAAIRAKLIPLHIRGFTLYDHGAFEISYRAPFNESEYDIWVSVNTEALTFKNAGILTMGGFKPPKLQKKPSLKTAAALYGHHREYGNEPELYKHYISLPVKEIDAYIDLFIVDKDDIDDRIDCLLYLALYSYSGGEKLPDKLYRFLIDNEVFYYGEIYLRADEKFAVELTDVLGTVDDEEKYQLTVSHILCALAAIPCKQTNDFLLQNSEKPLPIWARKLHILPKDYAYVGGWETTKKGPKLLFDEAITVFERCAKEEASKKSPVTALSTLCGFCGQSLALVFDGKQKLATCLYCSCYQTVYTKTKGSKLDWHDNNAPGDFFKKNPDYMKNDEEITTRLDYGLRPTKEKRRASYTAHQFAEISRTQIGGLPTAINDVEYPKCPDCGNSMRYAAQFDMADVEDVGEGIHYFFVCEDCGVVGANYGQS